jgi:hypothetical protein
LSLFDQTKAFKRGGTIPIKLQVPIASNANLSSSNTSLLTRDLRSRLLIVLSADA